MVLFQNGCGAMLVLGFGFHDVCCCSFTTEVLSTVVQTQVFFPNYLLFTCLGWNTQKGTKAPTQVIHFAARLVTGARRRDHI